MHYIGDGSTNNPFLVYDVETLKAVGRYGNTGRFENWTPELGIYYKLITNVNLAGSGDWEPIGSSADFHSTFDGNGKTIHNLTSTQNGMFSDFYGTVKDLNLANVNIDVNMYSSGGGLVGYTAGTIINCSVQGSLNCTYFGATGGIGGVAGWNYGTIENCYSNMTINSITNNIGGIVGLNQGIINKCFFDGTITVSVDYVGGIAGINQNTSGTEGSVRNCYSAGNIRGNQYVGGIVGGNFKNTAFASLSVVQKCYSLARVGGNTNNVGGIAGANMYAGSLINYCVALNTGVSLTSSFIEVGRICGANDGTINFNYSRSFFPANSTGSMSGITVSDPEDKNGSNLQFAPYIADVQAYLSDCPGGAPDLSAYY